MQKVLVICGPTCVGKSSFARFLAKELNGELINGDSMQVYQEMKIGTAKESEKEMKEIPHHLFDIKTIKESFSVAEFQRLLRKKIDEIEGRNHLPIIVGGTGLYLKAGLYDYEFLEKGDTDLGLNQKSTKELYDILNDIDAETAKEIHPNNRKRIIRAIELFYETEIGKSGLNKKQKHEPIYDVIYIGLTREREQLYKLINERVEEMFNKGLEEEARYIIATASKDSTALQAIGYKEFIDCDDTELIKENIKRNTRRFAKRQYTWFNNQMKVRWVDVENKTNEGIYDEIKEELGEWLNG